MNRHAHAAAAVLFFLSTTAAAPPAGAERLVLRDGLAISAASRGGRTLLRRDAVEDRVVRTGRADAAEDAELGLPGGSAGRWTRVAPDADGWFSGEAVRGGYVAFAAESDAEAIRILHAEGNGVAYVNGEPRAGDPYATGTVRLPIVLRKGINEIVLSAPRGRVRAALEAPEASVYVLAEDATLPDAVEGQTACGVAGVVVVNATTAEKRGRLAAAWEGSPAAATTSEAVVLPPLSARKLPVSLPERPPDAGPARVVVEFLCDDLPGGRSPARPFPVAVRPADATRSETFISLIDGSAQYYSVVPRAKGPGRPGEAPALILSLHGASVEAISQARAYSAKPWAVIVAPTNRRPFGFDWEDWGRMDALEVLTLAVGRFGADPRRVYLTGHSMGGHGTWHLGVTYPGSFAAIAPSAGWISFLTYAGGPPPEARPGTPAEVLRRSAAGSDTLRLVRNLDGLGVYVLHGDTDDNVPVEQARRMRRELAEFHADFAYFEKLGAGHWWGNECVDWPPLMNFVAGRVRPDPNAVRSVRFTTMNPAVSASRDWLSIVQQQRSLLPSKAHARVEGTPPRVVVETENVRRLAIDTSAAAGAAGAVQITADSQPIDPAPPDPRGVVHLLREASGRWTAAGPAGPQEKSPARAGPFKLAFDHRPVLVYGTGGTPEENAWALARARYDSEQFWVRGNGGFDVVADTEAELAALGGRSIVLYGNSTTNRAWGRFLIGTPVDASSGTITMPQRTIDGGDLSLLLVRPRPGEERTMVAAIGGTGIVGMRLTDRMPTFVSGVGIPDFVVIRASMLTEGEPGLEAAGFFGPAWEYSAEDSAVR
ncbi:MAG: prolyl oligopeptidase family serine peptidase [Phycisphaerales bacterium]|nr:prolyl oligopeptidase family serine peptidase [Phycisphaerales bacterium]